MNWFIFFRQHDAQRSLVSCRCGFRSSFLSGRTERCCENPAYDTPRTPQCNLQFVTAWCLFLVILVSIYYRFFVLRAMDRQALWLVLVVCQLVRPANVLDYEARESLSSGFINFLFIYIRLKSKSFVAT